MSAIKGKDTKPEVWLRKELFKRGFRYRLHRKDLPGKPDIVLPKYKAVIFVQGCFWHGHSGCPMFTMPATRTEFWLDKITKNKERDVKNIDFLESNGWKVLEVWECTVRGKGKLDPNELIEQVSRWIKLSNCKSEEISGKASS
jgi:DNA mismatch endonuclease (patch repair protein)